MPAIQNPVAFEANQGQADGSTAFLARIGTTTLQLGRDRIVLPLVKASPLSAPPPSGLPQVHQPKVTSVQSTVTMTFVGANPTPTITGLDELPGRANYFVGNDPSRWQVNVPMYGRVQYQDVYPGIDLVFYGTDSGQVEHDWIVHPGADAARIQLRVTGASSERVAATGALVLSTPAGNLTQTAPTAYQAESAGRRPVSSHYVLDRAGIVRLAVGPHDSHTTLVIDPAFVYSTYVSGAMTRGGRAVAVDSQHNVYIAGPPGYNGFTNSYNNATITVEKFDPTGRTLLYSTTFGGTLQNPSFPNLPYSLAVDSTGAAYVAGVDSSCDFPTVNQVAGVVPPCTENTGFINPYGFITKLSASGASMVYSSVVGGYWDSAFYGVAVDSSGDAYVTGETDAFDYPTTSNAYQRTFTGTGGGSSTNAVVSELTPSGGAFQFSTFLGGSKSTAETVAADVAVDASGNVYVDGDTTDSTYPVTSGAAQTTMGSRGADFITKFNVGGGSLSYSTLLGGSSNNWASTIAVDAAGEAFVGGGTYSTDFPTVNAFQNTKSQPAISGDSNYDATLTKVNASGTAFAYSSYLGGTGDQQANGVAVDAAGHAFIAGQTTAPDLPVTNAVQRSSGGGTDGFVAEFSTSGSTLGYLTYLGGGSNDWAEDITLDSAGDAYIAGTTNSNNFPVVAAYQPANSSCCVAALTKIQTVGNQAMPLGGAPNAHESGSFCWPCFIHWLVTHLVGDPVNTEYGTLTESVADLNIPARGAPLAFTRTYNSVSASTAGPLGYGWSFNAGASLAQDPVSGNVTVTQENGSQTVFTKTGSTYIPAAPRTIATLVQNANGTFTLTRQAREKLVFSSAGQVLSDSDLNGYTTTYTYGSGLLTTITDSSGSRSLTLAYTSGRITSVTDPIGRVVRFGYNDGAGNLTDVWDVNGGHTSLSYDSNHLLLTITDPRGAAVTNQYDSSQRVTSQTVTVVPNTPSANRTTTFGYSGDPTSTAGSTTTITDPKGNVTVEQYVNGVRTAVTRGYGTSQAATTTFAYDPQTLGLISTTDPNGHQTFNGYDASGNLLTVTDALGRVSLNTYDSVNDLTATTDPAGITTTLTYDASGNLLSRSTPLVGSNPAQNRTSGYTYGDSIHPGDVTAMTDPDGHTGQYTYDAYGDLASTTDPLGNKATTAYNAVGWVASSVSPRGNVTGCGCASQYTTTYSYNDPQTGTLDAFGDARVITDPLGHQTVRSYDADRNLISVKDADGNLTQFSYDLANEQTDVLRADGTTLHTDYNTDGTVLDQLDGASHKTSFGYDPLARTTSVTDPMSRTTTTAYDGAGNPITATDAAHQTTTFSYDAANERTGITYSDGVTPNVNGILYDPDGRRTQMIDGTGTSTWAYDSLGRLTQAVNGDGQTVSYTYDLAGRVLGLTYPNGQAVQRGYDNAGRLTSVTDWFGHTTTFTPDPDSNTASTAYPNGTTAAVSFDATDRAHSISDAPTATPNSPFASFTYTRDGNGQVASVSSTGVPSDNTTYGYTQLNQVSQVNATTFDYDSADNATRLINGATQTFDAADDVTTSTAGSGQTYGYDGRGDLTSILPTGGTATPLAYDQANRLTSYGSATTYTYNGDGLRMAKAAGGVTQRFAWDAADALLTDGLSASYVYGSGGSAVEEIDSPWLVGTATAGDAVSTTLTIALPAGIRANDQIIVASTQTADHAAPALAGYTAVGTVQSGGSSAATTAMTNVFRKTAAQGDTQVAVSYPGPLPYPKSVVVAVYRGVDPVNPVDGMSSQGAPGATQVTAPSVTTTLPTDELVLFQGASQADPTSTWSSPFTMTEEAQGSAPLLASGVADLQQSLAGASGSQTSTFNGVASAQLTTLLLALKPAPPLYYYADQLGSTRVIADQSGHVVSTYTFDPYGNLAGSTGAVTTGPLWGGQLRDPESGFYYLRARYYNPATAQFISVDRLAATTREPRSYGSDNPLNAKDSSGLDAYWCDERGVGCNASDTQGTAYQPHGPGMSTLSCDIATGDDPLSDIADNCRAVASCASIDDCTEAIDMYKQDLATYGRLADEFNCKDSPDLRNRFEHDLYLLHSYVDVVNVKGQQLNAATQIQNSNNCEKAWGVGAAVTGGVSLPLSLGAAAIGYAATSGMGVTAAKLC